LSLAAPMITTNTTRSARMQLLGLSAIDNYRYGHQNEHTEIRRFVLRFVRYAGGPNVGHPSGTSHAPCC
jgi:hypothetical protein